MSPEANIIKYFKIFFSTGAKLFLVEIGYISSGKLLLQNLLKTFLQRSNKTFRAKDSHSSSLLKEKNQVFYSNVQQKEYCFRAFGPQCTVYVNLDSTTGHFKITGLPLTPFPPPPPYKIKTFFLETIAFISAEVLHIIKYEKQRIHCK